MKWRKRREEGTLGYHISFSCDYNTNHTEHVLYPHLRHEKSSKPSGYGEIQNFRNLKVLNFHNYECFVTVNTFLKV